MTNKRSQETMAESFITKPGDVFTVIHQGGLSSSIPIRVTNAKTDEDFYIGLVNAIGSWEMLRKIDRMGARSVLVELESEDTAAYRIDPIGARSVLVELESKDTVAYRESMPYLHRFKKLDEKEAEEERSKAMSKSRGLIDSEYEVLESMGKSDLFDYLHSNNPKVTREMSDELHTSFGFLYEGN